MMEMAEKLRCRRQETFRMIQHDFQKEKKIIKLEADQKGYRRLEELWDQACQHEFITNGKVFIAWKHLGQIPSQMYTFTETYGRDLVFLNLDGNDLTDIGRIPYCCSKIQHLSLASNLIKEIPEDIALMTDIKHLNLVRNRIETLPLSIGKLANLEVFECANNCLTSLPASIANLAKLLRLNLECNNLQQLVNEVIYMKITVLNCNCNKLTALPIDMHLMGSLKVLTLCKNRITFIPERLEDSASLQVLHLSNNFITDLPITFGRLKSLKSLWLDFNKIRHLPLMLHELDSLVDLRMEGNDCKALTVATIIRPLSLLEKALASEKLAIERENHNQEMENIETVVEKAMWSAQQFLDSEDGCDIIFRAATDLWRAIRIRKPDEDNAMTISCFQTLMNDEAFVKCLNGIAPSLRQALTQMLVSYQESSALLVTRVKEREKRERGTMVFQRNNDLMVTYIEDDMRKHFVELVGDMKRCNVGEVNRKVKVVLRSWVGASLMEIFWAWQSISEDRKSMLKWEKFKELQDSRLNYEQECAFLIYAMDQVNEWVQHWDEFNDMPYWVHSRNGTMSNDEPSPTHYLPQGWTPPIPPEWMLNELTGEVLSPRSLNLKRNAAFSIYSEGKIEDNTSI